MCLKNVSQYSFCLNSWCSLGNRFMAFCNYIYFRFLGGGGDFFWGEIYSILFTLTLIYPKKRAEQYSCA